MAFAPILKKAYWSLVIAGGLYFVFLSLLLNGWIQRQAIYSHNVPTSWHQDPSKPEKFGFLRGQVRPFAIRTDDGEVLWGWHILPIGLYIDNEKLLVEQHRGFDNHQQSLAFKLLAEDPESRLVIYFHGNAGTVAQGWRTDTYRVLASAQPAKIHVMAIDYRGFGKSTGSPNEQGLIQDGITLVRYAMETVGIAPERIVLVGQSLGSAVATAVVEWFTRNDPSAEFYEWPIEFKGLVLVAAFSDIPTLMLTYTIGGIIPILSPLRPYPFLQRFFAKGIQETWLTSTRLANLVRRSKNVELHLIHSKDDFEIPWSHSDTLFHAAANATSEKGLTSKQIESLKSHTDLGDYGQMNYWQTVQKDGGRKMIYQTIVNQGGHNRVVTYPVVARAVLRALYADHSTPSSE